MESTNIFAKRIKTLRESLGISQAGFAKEVGTTQTTLSSYENLNKTPSLDIVKNIAQKYNVSIDWLCGLSNQQYLNNNIKTYSDIIQMLLKLETVDLYDFEIATFTDPQGDRYCSVILTDYNIANFADEWNKMRDMHGKNIIDDELYALWIEKTLKKYDKQIVSTNNNVFL